MGIVLINKCIAQLCIALMLSGTNDHSADYRND